MVAMISLAFNARHRVRDVVVNEGRNAERSPIFLLFNWVSGLTKKHLQNNKAKASFQMHLKLLCTEKILSNTDGLIF